MATEKHHAGFPAHWSRMNTLAKCDMSPEFVDMTLLQNHKCSFMIFSCSTPNFVGVVAWCLQGCAHCTSCNIADMAHIHARHSCTADPGDCVREQVCMELMVELTFVVHLRSTSVYNTSDMARIHALAYTCVHACHVCAADHGNHAQKQVCMTVMVELTFVQKQCHMPLVHARHLCTADHGHCVEELVCMAVKVAHFGASSMIPMSGRMGRGLGSMAPADSVFI
eukprot:1156874-Pelagomonas_calceolata.AAC.8